MWRYHWRSEEGVQAPGARVTSKVPWQTSSLYPFSEVLLEFLIFRIFADQNLSGAQSLRMKFCALTTFLYRLFFHLPVWLIFFPPQGTRIVFSLVQLPRLAFDFPQFANQMQPYGQGTPPPTTTFSRIKHCLHPNLSALHSTGKWPKTQIIS